jgi:hypothetical protein
MATIPSGTKFIGLSPDYPTIERRSSLINSESEAYTMQDIIDTISASFSSNPQVIDLKVTNGTPVTGTTVNTISQTLLIPANTFTSAGGMIEFMARFQKTGTAGNQYCNVYVNTSPTLTGGSALAWFNANTSTFVQGLRTAKISSNTITLTSASSTAITDYFASANAQTSAPFDVSVDNYLIFTIQLFNAADSSVVEMARVLKYE